MCSDPFSIKILSNVDDYSCKIVSWMPSLKEYFMKQYSIYIIIIIIINLKTTEITKQMLKCLK